MTSCICGMWVWVFLGSCLQFTKVDARPQSFLHTSTAALHHGLWIGWIAPTSSISFTWEWTSSTIGGGILWNLSLKGSSSVTLIWCLARSMQPQVPGKRCHSIQLAGLLWWLNSWQTTPPGQASVAAGRAPPFSAQPTSLPVGSLESCGASLTILVTCDIPLVVQHLQLPLKWSWLL